MSPESREPLAHPLDTLPGGPSPRVSDADALAASVHEGQLRPDGAPYVQHPRAVLASVLQDAMDYDEDVVVAALLHDAVEDQAERVAAALSGTSKLPTERERALAGIAEQFGDRTARIVDRLSHEPLVRVEGESEEAFRQRKREDYATDVLALFDEEDAGPLRIKLADLAENALSLHNLPDGPKREKLIAKYGPVVSGILDRLDALEGDDPRAPLRDAWRSAYQSRFPPT